MQLLQAETGWSFKMLINLLILVMVFSGIFGFVYEEIFYRIDLGRWVKRGSSYGPWIPIYAFSGAAYTLFVYPFKDKPLLVFFLCVFVSGVLEYITGWVLFEIFHTRLWDYNTEILNYGNIKGYVCLRSVLFFGISGLALIYMIIPVMIKVMNMLDPSFLTVFCMVMALIFAADCLLYRINNKFSKG